MKILISTFKALFCFLATMLFVASYAQAQLAETITEAIATEDLDGDLKLDTVNEDIDGDDFLDAGEVFIDSNNDGIWNDAVAAVLGDNPNTPQVETTFELSPAVAAEFYTDTNGNGVYDNAEVDINENGIADAFVEQFIDDNLNGLYDLGEVYTDLNENDQWDAGEPFVDAGDGVWNAAEAYIDANGNQQYDVGEVFTDEDGDNVWDDAEVLTFDLDNDGEFDSQFVEDFDGDENLDLANEDFDLDTNLDVIEDDDSDGEIDITFTTTYESFNNVYDEGEEYTDENDNGEYDLGEAFVDENELTEVDFITEGTFNFESAGLTHNDVDLVDANELATSLAPLEADIATNAANIATNAANIATNAADIATNSADIQVNRDGVAMAAAISHSTILPGMTQALDISHASFEGSSAMSINYSRKVKEGVQVNLSHASAGDSHINKVGVGFQW